ncbi:MAG: HEAT repeat domain-containing protein [Candidatus Contendobacter sp.]|nr:HEAT repeat domain-containing protein [Candidatus Contendobacter sp.]MDS4058588.1 HEAT repeat domain-containing protein [Candidatus Contendobacter sp.]
MNASVPSPYKGLRPYEEQDRDNFFSREKECRILIDKILVNKLTLLFAASGVGKSSLLQAAVLPRLKDPRHENRDGVYYNDWVSPPLEGLKQQVLKTLQQQSLLENVALPAELPERSLNEFFSFCALFTRQPLVVVLDQFEEFFQYQRHTTDFKPFIQQLSAVVTDRDAPIAVVIAMREDFALELNAFKPTLPTLLFENFYRLERLDQANARKAIEEPAQRVDFRFEPDLLEALLKDLATREQRGLAAIPLAEELDTVEPAYLQLACSQLWEAEQRNPDRSLRLQTYQDKGRAAGILKNYVESIIGGFSSGDKKLASKAFDHLITRRGTKMAYTAGDLAQFLGVKGEALAKVLDRLETSRILRRQSRQGVFWYELYHDLFSKPIEEWNEVYKAKQRNKRAVLWAVDFVVAGLALYGAYNILMNYTSYHFRLSAKQGISDGIEFYRGKAGSDDILGLKGYIAETGYLRSQLEPDKLFDIKAVGDYDVLNGELIDNLPLTKRIVAYWDDGQIQKFLESERRSISEYDIPRSEEIIRELTGFCSLPAVRVLMDKLEKIADSSLKAKIIVALGATRRTDAVDSLLKIQDEPSQQIQLAVVEALSRLGDPRAVEPLLQRLADTDSSVRQAAAEALGALGDPRAVEHLVQRLAAADGWMRRAAVEALGQLGDIARGRAPVATAGRRRRERARGRRRGAGQAGRPARGRAPVATAGRRRRGRAPGRRRGAGSVG